jgi:hypothetical protein
MSSGAPQATHNPGRIVGAVVLIIVAVVIAAFCAPFIVQAFRGPRTITEKELLSMKEAGWWDNYVRFRPAGAAKETNVVFGKPGNEGTRYVLLPVGDRALFCSVRISSNNAEFVGNLESFGGTENEAVQKGGIDKGKLLPFMLQSVRSIWLETVGALIGILACLGLAAWLLIQVWMTGQGRSKRRREEDEERDERERY